MITFFFSLFFSTSKSMPAAPTLWFIRLHAQLKPRLNGNVIKVRPVASPLFNGISNLAANEINSSSCTNVSPRISS